MSELNPTKSIDTLLTPAPLKLGELLILERFEIPAIHGDFSSMLENGFACWLLKQDRKHILTLNRTEALAEATIWLDSITKLELIKEVNQLVDAICLYYETLPKQEESQKKTTNEPTE